MGKVQIRVEGMIVVLSGQFIRKIATRVSAPFPAKEQLPDAMTQLH